MQSILGIVVGLASHAPLNIYDEPYLWLYAAYRWLFYNILIKDYIENPRTITLPGRTELVQAAITYKSVISYQQIKVLSTASIYEKNTTQELSKWALDDIDIKPIFIILFVFSLLLLPQQIAAIRLTIYTFQLMFAICFLMNMELLKKF